MNQIRTWQEFFLELDKTINFQNMKRFIENADETIVFPKKKDVFNAFTLTPLSEIKVVILGQDPYHQPGQAMGLAFSVPSGQKLPPSLKNIYKEIHDDIGGPLMRDGDLTYLAKQGVFLFNTVLTVEKGKPLSHASASYLAFTKDVIKLLNEAPQPIVFILWGTHAKSFKKYINGSQKFVIEGNHPSPLSANRGGFFGLKYFSKTNALLSKNGIKPINWHK